jgi:nucleoside triphosphatase
MVNSHDEIFLAKYPKWEGRWAIPGGKVEYGENLETALRREILEETAIHIVRAEFFRLSESIFAGGYRNGKWHLVFLDYLCTEIKDRVVLDQKELIEYEWVSIKNSLNMDLTPPTRATLEDLFNEIKSGKRNEKFRSNNC